MTVHPLTELRKIHASRMQGGVRDNHSVDHVRHATDVGQSADDARDARAAKLDDVIVGQRPAHADPRSPVQGRLRWDRHLDDLARQDLDAVNPRRGHAREHSHLWKSQLRRSNSSNYGLLETGPHVRRMTYSRPARACEVPALEARGMGVVKRERPARQRNRHEWRPSHPANDGWRRPASQPRLLMPAIPREMAIPRLPEADQTREVAESREIKSARVPPGRRSGRRTGREKPESLSTRSAAGRRSMRATRNLP
jgi:hypothetical protein